MPDTVRLFAAIWRRNNVVFVTGIAGPAIAYASVDMKRVWAIAITPGMGGAPAVRISVDGRELLPGLRVSTPVDALEYIDEALLDFRRGDEVSLSAWYPPRVLSTFSTRVRAIAILWCAEVLEITCEEEPMIAPAAMAAKRPRRRRLSPASIYSWRARRENGPN